MNTRTWEVCHRVIVSSCHPSCHPSKNAASFVLSVRLVRRTKSCISWVLVLSMDAHEAEEALPVLRAALHLGALGERLHCYT